MKTLTTLITVLLLFTCMACQKQDAKPEADVVQDEKVEAPKIDLHSAVMMGDLEAIKKHIAAKSDLNIKEPTRGSTALISAAVFAKTKAAKMLIEAGADLNVKNNDGSTALHTAAFFCKPDIVKALVEKGADKALTNSEGKTALEIVTVPFEKVEPIYKAFEQSLKPLGVTFDYDQMKKARPVIAEMLK